MKKDPYTVHIFLSNPESALLYASLALQYYYNKLISNSITYSYHVYDELCGSAVLPSMHAFCLLWPKRKPKNAFVLWLSMVQQYKQSPLINIMYHLISTFVWIQIWLISKHDMYVYALYSWCRLLSYWQSTHFVIKVEPPCWNINIISLYDVKWLRFTYGHSSIENIWLFKLFSSHFSSLMTSYLISFYQQVSKRSGEGKNWQLQRSQSSLYHSQLISTLSSRDLIDHQQEKGGFFSSFTTRLPANYKSLLNCVLMPDCTSKSETGLFFYINSVKESTEIYLSWLLSNKVDSLNSIKSKDYLRCTYLLSNMEKFLFNFSI